MTATPVRFARCENEIEVEHPVLAYVPCLGLLAFRPQDGDAPCDTCGARCGALVADYIGPAGPWPQAHESFRRDVALAWVADHEQGHPRGVGRCPLGHRGD